MTPPAAVPNRVPPSALDPFSGASGTLEGFAGQPDQVLRRLELTITRRLDGLLHGNHLGLVPGHGSELGETRAYQPGDDVRRIDWNVTARMQSPFLRQTIADRELETWVVVDLSPSLDFGTALCEKRDLAVAAAAAVGFLTNHTGNRIGGMLLGPRGDRIFPARGGRDHLMAFLHLLATAERVERGTTDLGAGLKHMGAITRRRGMVVVISDFLDQAAWADGLSRLAVRHDVLAIEIVDPRELSLPDVGTLVLTDPETGATAEVDTSSRKLRERFHAAATTQREAIAGAIRRSGADHLELRTDRDWLRDLIRFVGMRRQRQTRAPSPRAVKTP
ncbi:MAG TPA: DUF58 domain-containing protein [Acidimicrobiales bacterium]